MVPKTNGSWWPCTDFRCLNNIAANDRKPIPHIHDFSIRLEGTTIFFKMDWMRGYYQVPLHTDDVPETAVISQFVFFEFLCIPFGLMVAAQTSQRLIDSVLLFLAFMFFYLNDKVVVSPSAEEHRVHLKQFFPSTG